MSFYTLFSGIVCGLFMLSGGFSLFLYFRRIERGVNLSYVALTIAIVGIIFCGVIGGYVEDITTAVWLDKWLNTFFLLAGISILVMIVLMTGYNVQWMIAILIGSSVLLLIANWSLPFGITFESVSGIEWVHTVWGEEHARLRGITGTSHILTILLILALMVYCLLAVRHDFRQGNRRHAVRLSIVLSIAFGGVLIDTVLIEFDVATIGIIDDLGFIGFAFMIAYRTFDNLLRSNELIRESRERAVHLTEAAFEGIAFIENGLVLDVNEQLAEMFGYRPIEMIGRPVTDFVPATVRNEIPTGERVLDGQTYQYQARHHDGSILPIEVRVKTMTRRNRIVRVTAIRDISERMATEAALVAAKEHAERSERLKDAFIANISHEVRTPLNIIVGYTGLISESVLGKATEEEKDYFDSVQRGAQRLMRTVDMILSTSRLQVGDFTLDPVRLELRETVMHIVDDYRPAAEKKDIRLVHNLPQSEVYIMADEHCIVQSLHNLLDNALKYTAEGVVEVSVSREMEGEVVMSVCDSGIGIAPEYLPTIFTPYSQEESGYSRSYDGVGLGLSLVKRYVQLNAGSVHIESEKGKGTTVTLRFPESDLSSGGDAPTAS